MNRFINSKYSKKLVVQPDSKYLAGNAGSAGEKFRSYSLQLAGNDHIGLQFSPKNGGGWDVFAISNKKSYLKDDDLNWLFKGVIKQEKHEFFQMQASSGDDSKIYAVRVPSAKEFKYDYENRYQSCYTGELLDLMAECGAGMQLLFGNGKGIALIIVKGNMPMRLRSLISMFFCESIPRPLDNTGEEEYGSDNVFLCMLTRNILTELGERAGKDQIYEDDKFLDDIAQIDDDLEFFEDPDESENGIRKEKDDPSVNQVLIEDMEFSVRTYNCLKRAGINNAEQLVRMTENEVLNIRSMSSKCLEEIKTRLMEKFGMTLAVPEHKSYLAQLDELVGLDDVKEQVRRIVAFARMKKDFADRGDDNLSIALNMSFVGNPGTAKTTVARILAGIFYEIGLVENDDLIEVGRSDLVGEYVGKTAIKVEKVFQKARGRVLFIDEAYALVDGYSNSFGDEAINTLVQQIENHRKETIVIFAGYPDKMEKFLSRNPGLRSRVPFCIEFKDYEAETLVKIAEKEAESFGFEIAPDAKEKMLSLCTEAAKSPEFGNGRFSRNIIEHALIDYAARAYGSDITGSAPEHVLNAGDISLPLNMKKAEPQKKFGFI